MLLTKLAQFNAKIREANNRIFNNPQQDILIQKFETLKNAMNANTRQESEFYLKQLNNY